MFRVLLDSDDNVDSMNWDLELKEKWLRDIAVFYS